MLTAQKLIEVFNYEFETGEIRWAKDRGPHVRAGKIAGTLDKDGYRVIQYDRKIHKAHRLAFLFKHGRWPLGQLDHINGIRTDNRPENLREATPGENCQNIRKYSNNSSGFVGVTWHKKQRKFIASIRKNKRRYHLGCFETAEDAGQSYELAKFELHNFQPVLREC